MKSNEAIIKYFGQKARVKCDRKCEKATGRNGQSTVVSSYECRDTKPTHPDQFPNKWCVRECERCTISKAEK